MNLEDLNAKLGRAWDDFLSRSNFAKLILSEPVDPRLYTLYMIETYHYTAHNARNQALVGVRAKGVSPNYTKFCFEHAEEETGHELMALHDVQSMGVKVQADELPQPLPETETLIAYLYWISAFGNPLQRLGYSFWAENVYSYIGTLLKKIQKDLALKNSQMTFFISHSAIDADHAEEVKAVIQQNCKSPEDWQSLERVMLTSLNLTLQMTEGVLREFRKVQNGQPSPYAQILNCPPGRGVE